MQLSPTLLKQRYLWQSNWVSVSGSKWRGRSPLMPSPTSPSSPPPLLHPRPLPVAPGVPGAGWGHRESPTNLASSPSRPRLEAEPLGDNFDSHNDAGGNHFKEDQSSLKSAHLLPRLRPTLPDSGASCRFARQLPLRQRFARTGEVHGGQGQYSVVQRVSFRSSLESLAVWAPVLGFASRSQHQFRP